MNKSWLIFIMCGLSFFSGMYVDGVRADREKLELETAQKDAIIKAQKDAREKYSAEVEALNRDLESLRAQSDDRMRELEAYRNRKPSNPACHEDDALRLAVEGEKLLKEANSYLETLIF